jgi:co-chaperonin GroES (HSP10)
MENTSGHWPVNNLLLIRPKRSAVEERMEKLGLKPADSARDREQGAVTMGEVVAAGPGPYSCWDADDTPRPGEIVTFKRYAWACLDETMTADGERYWVLPEEDIFTLPRRLGLKSAKMRENGLDKEGDHSARAA